jgi:hypothetical protein
MAKGSMFKMKGGFRAVASAVGGSVCPPGVICMNNNTLFFGLCVLLLIAGLCWFLFRSSDKVEPLAPIVAVDGGAGAVQRLESEYNRVAPVPLAFGGPFMQPMVPPRMLGNGTDPRFSPLPPEQSYYVPPANFVGGRAIASNRQSRFDDVPPDTANLIQQPIPAGIGAMIPVRGVGVPQLLSPINQLTQGYPDAYQQMGVLTAPGGNDNTGSPNRTILPLFGRRTNYGKDRWNYYTRTDGMNPVQVPLQFKRQNCDDDNGCQEIITGDSVGVPILGQSYTANVYRYATPRYMPV